jgi:hypothetical protein
VAGDFDSGGALELPLAFLAHPTGAAIVNVAGPIRQMVDGIGESSCRHPAIVAGTAGDLGWIVQVQLPSIGGPAADRKLP